VNGAPSRVLTILLMFGGIAARCGRRAERSATYSHRADRLNPNIVFPKRDSYQWREHLTVTNVTSYRLTLLCMSIIETGLPARSAKLSALQNARKLCFEWRMGENDARTLVGVQSCGSGKTAADNPPSNRHARRCAARERRASPPARLGAMHTFKLSFPTQMTQATGKAILVVRPHGVHGVTSTKGFCASARPPPQIRTPMFARHSRRFATQTELHSIRAGRFEGPKFWRPRASEPRRTLES